MNITVPVLSIQCDWEDFVDVPYKQIWISCKFRGENSIHGKLSGGTKICDSADFSAELGRNSLCLRHLPTNCLTRFIPAFKVFGNIHKQGVLSVDAADGGLGVSICQKNQLKVWDNASGQVRRDLTGHVGDVYKCKLFPSGIVVLTGGADMQLKIWSAETGQCPVSLIGHRAPITDFSIIDRGRNILSISKDGTARLWDCGQSKCIATVFESNDTLNTCSIGQLPNSISGVDATDEREIGTKDKILLIGSEENRIYGIALSSRNVIFETDVGSPVNSISYFSQDVFVAGTQDGRILLCNLTTGAVEKIIHESNSPVLCVAPFKDKGVFVGRHDGTTTYYSVLSETSDRLQLTGPDYDPVYSIAITSDYIFVGCRDGKIRKYKVIDIIAGGA